MLANNELLELPLSKKLEQARDDMIEFCASIGSVTPDDLTAEFNEWIGDAERLESFVEQFESEIARVTESLHKMEKSLKKQNVIVGKMLQQRQGQR